MSRLGKLVTLGAQVAAYRRQLGSYRNDVVEAAKVYVDAHCDSDSLEECTEKFVNLEKAVKKLRALESMR